MAWSTNQVALRVHALGVDFSGVRALEDVSFSVPAGGVSAVIGPNGAGKTTLFNCISGVARHDGTVELEGCDLTHLRADRRAALGIARTFQTPLLIPDLTAIDNVLLGAHPQLRGGLLGSIFRPPAVRSDERLMRARASELLARLGLPRADVPVDSLPHGDRRRVEVVRALLPEPRLLLLDEPAAGLGADEASELLGEVEAFAAAVGTTCVLVEHDVGLVMRVSRHVVVLDAGRLLLAGSPAEVAADPRVIAAYLGDDWSEVKT
ncbi:ABC transporter ATP-binding protein [Pseudonocardia sp. DSM 110487]|uniref:ABC transporter ATP-binding protein n=1 Tax=Pseudonocardia sp. DSM 110487 TaxID=2865833 RepID=UPI002101F9A1|nr:ATP-binding cassette domain-containing protein [Pseudonocardia sp. DSM 110487]